MDVTDPKKTAVTLDILEIMKIMPHSYPFLMIDRVLKVIPGKSIVALKNVTINEPFFPGHLPGNPVMPGVLQLEGLAQTAGLLLALELGVPRANGYLAGFDERIRFKKVVRPGDQLIYKVHFIDPPCKAKIFKLRAQAFVEDKPVTSKFTILLVPTESTK